MDNFIVWTILSQLLHNILDFMVSLMYVHTYVHM